MLIHRMSANFGKLQGQTLELKDGLNIIEAPNETGKSTWCAFLSAMLYGINSRERDKAGFLAEKNRFAPWNGTAMLGRIDCSADGKELSLLRATRRPSAPMAEFRAMYAESGTVLPELTGENCGETLLGVSREVYERSAFIRQDGLALSQNTELEKRIAELISTGEDGSSYSEAMEELKKQLNRRRHNKTGQIPALEQQLAALEQQILKARQLDENHGKSRRETEALEKRREELLEERRTHERWENLKKQLSAKDAEEAERYAAARLEELRTAMEADRIPPNDTIGRLRGAIVNLGTVRKSVEKARSQRDEAARVLYRAEEAVNQSPFAGLTAEQARREPASSNAPTAHWKELAVFFAFLAFGAGTAFFLIPRTEFLGGIWQVLPWAVFVGLTAVGFGVSRMVRSHEAKAARDVFLSKRFGTTDAGEISAMAEDYVKLLETLEAAQADSNAKSAAAESLHATFTSNEQAILLEVRRFAPGAFDVTTADNELRRCAQRRKELADAELACKEAQMRLSFLQGNTDGKAPVSPEMAPPLRRLDVVEHELRHIEAQLLQQRSETDQMAGRLSSAGDPAALEAEAQQLRNEIAALEQEYAAIRLSMEELEKSHAELQQRFSPVLGRRTGEIFSALTDGAYDSVVLDRDLSLSATPAGDPQYRELAYLSAGATDQLYLAARLAISELVLPREKKIPLVLDDALANFDDRRCRAALRWLKEEAANRQIILFTCHSREADFFAEDREVHIQRLTNAPRQV
ncbi:MAG: AAA family ATPase [Oscillibacter sp.]|nr:AAA family ATPase [Oscillibacter sp.]